MEFISPSKDQINALEHLKSEYALGNYQCVKNDIEERLKDTFPKPILSFVLLWLQACRLYFSNTSLSKASFEEWNNTYLSYKIIFSKDKESAVLMDKIYFERLYILHFIFGRSLLAAHEGEKYMLNEIFPIQEPCSTLELWILHLLPFADRPHDITSRLANVSMSSVYRQKLESLSHQCRQAQENANIAKKSKLTLFSLYSKSYERLQNVIKSLEDKLLSMNFGLVTRISTSRIKSMVMLFFIMVGVYSILPKSFKQRLSHLIMTVLNVILIA